jgi:hypothetical protein
MRRVDVDVDVVPAICSVATRVQPVRHKVSTGNSRPLGCFENRNLIHTTVTEGFCHGSENSILCQTSGTEAYYMLSVRG